MEHTSNTKKSPTHLAQQSRLLGTGQGGRKQPLNAGLLRGGSAGAHNWSAQIGLVLGATNVDPEPHGDGHGARGKEDGDPLHGSVQVFGVDRGKHIPGAARHAVDAQGDEVHDQHSVLRQATSGGVQPVRCDFQPVAGDLGGHGHEAEPEGEEVADGARHGSGLVLGAGIRRGRASARFQSNKWKLSSAAVDLLEVPDQRLNCLNRGVRPIADQLGRQVPASDGGLNAVTDGGWKLFRPLTDCGCADPDGISGGRDGPAQELDGFRFAHFQILVHLASCVKCT